jgi:uncharacterized protein YgiM (DUF1202 family)
MPNDEYETLGSDPIVRVVRHIVPWVLLGLIVWALSGAWTGFQRAKQLADATANSTEPTVTASVATSTTTTTVTGMTAVTRVDLKLRSQADASSEVLATSRKGSTLTVLERQGTWFRVKDGAGHIGWIPNNSQYIDVRTKKK